MNGIADTGLLNAFGNRNDQRHGWAVNMACEVADRPLTCEAVLGEAASHLGDARLVRDFISAGGVQFNRGLDSCGISDAVIGWGMTQASGQYSTEPDRQDPAHIRVGSQIARGTP